ncbi:glycoside hydrolase family 6 protein [Streptomyces sp. NPDC058740]|uniref:glycoside hydrolase family 6 protein n=1 Tax=unclassified Streptomyces TaxID=2593676 RepID=UPI0036C6B236
MKFRIPGRRCLALAAALTACTAWTGVASAASAAPAAPAAAAVSAAPAVTVAQGARAALGAPGTSVAAATPITPVAPVASATSGVPIVPIVPVVRAASAALVGPATPGAPAATGVSAPTADVPPAPGPLTTATRFYVDPDNAAARQAVVDAAAGDAAEAENMRRLAALPQAAWFTGGTPAQARASASALLDRARSAHQVPVLVAYDIPGRDCGLYSSGGAASSSAYREWITALAEGVGQGPAVVLLEPDGLANLPKDCAGGIDPTGELTAARLADLDFAVTTLKRSPGTAVYLDAGNSQWKAVGDIARRLIDAGVRKADGFALNVSNFQPTDQLTRYGTWVAKCVWFAAQGPDWARGHTDWCASQYYSAAAPNDGAPGNAVSAADPSTWHWTDAWYDRSVGTPPAAELLHFVVDTSRNGRGPWTPAPGTYGDPETWCNPPGRGIGPRPTADTGVPLADAYLYVKTIGESDGSCTRGTTGTLDPEYGVVDPPAGAWWPRLAHELARNAQPALTP